MTDAYRQTIREKIAAGVQSLRDGRVVDGPSVMARIDAEMAERERQGR
jgi:predicted transcriptional regulator